MTQIKNINAMQELTEVQEDMADTHDKFHNKSLKGKKGYITFARTKEGMFICGDGESSVIKGIQARVLVGEEVLADCYRSMVWIWVSAVRSKPSVNGSWI